ncbi:hypothetical protein RRG08_022295 [Elysia crispata]|uniref:Uncharacterized protein n=1 Tax=Elysia crispata TaxID=231223 RepID=A0AAE0ZRB4_9GAST|nr:hypothetical protein RRG08_022295 [Elysia crispata]
MLCLWSSQAIELTTENLILSQNDPSFFNHDKELCAILLPSSLPTPLLVALHVPPPPPKRMPCALKISLQILSRHDVTGCYLSGIKNLISADELQLPNGSLGSAHIRQSEEMESTF